MKSWCGLTFVSGDDYSLPFNCGWGLVLREAVMTSRYNYFGDVDESCWVVGDYKYAESLTFLAFEIESGKMK
mgnify:CR=1 FL=1